MEPWLINQLLDAAADLFIRDSWQVPSGQEGAQSFLRWASGEYFAGLRGSNPSGWAIAGESAAGFRIRMHTGKESARTGQKATVPLRVMNSRRLALKTVLSRKASRMHNATAAGIGILVAVIHSGYAIGSRVQPQQALAGTAQWYRLRKILPSDAATGDLGARKSRIPAEGPPVDVHGGWTAVEILAVKPGGSGSAGRPRMGLVMQSRTAHVYLDRLWVPALANGAQGCGRRLAWRRVCLRCLASGVSSPVLSRHWSDLVT